MDKFSTNKFALNNKNTNNSISTDTKEVDLVNNVTSTENKSFFESLSGNPYFNAGFALVGVGALLTTLKKATSVGYTLVQKNLTVSLEVVSKDKSYDWILKWINLHLKERAQHINVETYFERNDKNQRISTSFSFTPSIGIHYFSYKNRWIRAERVREQVVDRNTGSPVETLKLTTLGRDIGLFTSILNESRKMALKEQTGKTLIYNARTGMEWGLSGWPKDKRPFTSVILDKGIAENIRNDILDFLKSSKWYRERGIPYRRGYLLYGPPGTGKTSFITALAGKFLYSKINFKFFD